MLFPHPNLLRYWPLHGDSKDYSGRGFDLTLTGCTYTQGRYGLALNLDGVDDCGTCAATGLPGGTNPSGFTFVCTGMRTTLDAPVRHLMSYGALGAGNDQCLLWSHTSGNANKFGHATAANGYLLNFAPVAGQMFHFAWEGLLASANNINNTPQATGYKDGVQDSANAPSYASDPPDSGTFYLGALHTAPVTTNWLGTLEEVSIWNVRLTPFQIRAVMAGRMPVI